MTLETIRTSTQRDGIREHLLSGKPITPLEALRLFHCFRLGARIYELRKEGMDIKTQLVKTEDGAHVASYFLEAHQFELV